MLVNRDTHIFKPEFIFDKKAVGVSQVGPPHAYGLDLRPLQLHSCHEFLDDLVVEIRFFIFYVDLVLHYSVILSLYRDLRAAKLIRIFTNFTFMSPGNNTLNLITVLGHTAGGKTRFAACLADRIGAEVISADSRQVYRRMNLGTGKDYGDYLVGGRKIRHHLIDILEPGYEYNVYEYQKDFFRVYRDVLDRGKVALLCGGSGLYIEAVLKGYRLIPVPANKSLREELEKKSMEKLRAELASFRNLHNITDTGNRKRLIRALEIELYQ